MRRLAARRRRRGLRRRRRLRDDGLVAVAALPLAGGGPGGRPSRVGVRPPSRSLDTLRRGETVSELLRPPQGRRPRPRRSRPALALDPRRLRAGLVFSFRSTAPDTLPNRISVRTSPEQRVIFHRVARWLGRGGRADCVDRGARPDRGRDRQLALRGARRAGAADDQLDGGDRQRLAWDLADVYAWQVDFTRDIQPGDRFQVVFERLVSEDGETRFGRVLASDLTMSGKSLTAFRFDAGRPSRPSTTPSGSSLRRAFLRAPVQFRRISSTFARAPVPSGPRHHPPARGHRLRRRTRARR